LYALAILRAIENDRCDPLDRDRETRRRLIRDPTPSDFARLYDAIGQFHSDEERIEAVEVLTCLAEARPNAQDFVDFVPCVVFLLQSESTRLSAAAALAVAVLGLNHPTCFGDHDAVEAVVGLLQNGDTQQKERAADALAALVGDDTIRRQAAAASAIEPLLQLLRNGGGEQKVNAAVALYRLAKSARHRSAIAEAGAAQPLLDLLRSDDEEETTSALFTIIRLAHDNDANRILFFGEGVEATVVQLLDSPTYKRKCRVAEMAAYFVAGSDASQGAFLNGGGVTALLALLRDGRNHDKAHAAFAIGCVGENHDASKQAVVATGGIELLVQSLSCTRGSVQQRAASALQKLLTHDDGVCRRRIYQAGALALLLRVLRGSIDSGKSEAAKLLWSLVKNNEEDIIAMASQGVLKLVADHLQASEDDGGAVAVLNALNYFCKPRGNEDAADDERLGEPSAASARVLGAKSHPTHDPQAPPLRQLDTGKQITVDSSKTHARPSHHLRAKFLDEPPKKLCQTM
jgi:hypothetical protein